MILIIDNYDSFTYNLVHLIAASVDDYEVVRNDKITVDEIAQLAPNGILISPGPGRPEDAGIINKAIKTYAGSIPILGVCLGLQAIGMVFGAKVVHAPKLMHGKTSQIQHDGKGVFKGIENGFTATRYHSLVLDEQTIPDEFIISARSDDEAVMGIRHRDLNLEGVQFHPESHLTEYGDKMINNWINKCHSERSPDGFYRDEVEESH